MSRAVIFDALTGSAALAAAGVPSDRVFPNYAMDQVPTRKGLFIVYRWGNSSRPFGRVSGPRSLEVWVHCPKQMGSSFGPVDRALDVVDDILGGLLQQEGSDGVTVTSVSPTGRSGDLYDDGFETITRNASYEVLARKSN